jgi:hypothetical protein
VYFDLQSTNTHNNSTGLAPQLQFLENRDAPIVENSGEYTMSVTRFSVDTANLPVLVVEPDIIGDEGFDAGKTIHRVAVISEGANLKINSSGAVSISQVDSFLGQYAGSKFGKSVASSNDGEIIVIGEPITNLSIYVPPFVEPNPEDGYNNRPQGYLNINGRGDVWVGVRRADGTYAVDRISDPIGYANPDNLRTGTITLNWQVGLNVAVSGDGNTIFIGSGPACPYFWIFNRLTGAMSGKNKTDFSTKPSSVVGALNTNGTLYIVGFPARLGTATLNEVGGYEIFSHNTTTNVSTSRISVTGASTDRNMGLAVAMNGIGNIAVATKTTSSTGGSIDVIQSTASPHYVSAYGTYPYVSTLDGFGTSLSINNAGTLIAVGCLLENSTGKVTILSFGSGSFATATGGVISPDTYTGAIGFGASVALSYDGNTIHVGIPYHNSNTGVVQTFQYSGSQWDFKAQTIGVGTNTYYGISVSSFHDGIEYIAGAETITNNTGARVSKLTIATNETLPLALTNTASVANVFWSPDNNTLAQPTKSQLNGVNTATFPYYHCHSYNNFIDKVNVAIKEAYVANFNKLWTEWISTLSVANAAFIKAEFLNIVARCFPTPPYMVWNSTLDANLYLNTLFSAIGNYYAPSRTFAASGASPNTQVSTTGSPQPLNLRLAFNASLYSLFSSFPATETIIDGEKFYMLNMPQQVPLLQDTSTIPLRALPLMPNYPFLYDYHNNITKVFTLPYPTDSVPTYPLQDYFIILKQEISTIDAWCPISSIVFTSNQLPIIPSQFSSSNTTGNETNSAIIGNRFALVITDLMTNQQGFRPNVIYNPTAEYRRLTLTGNMGIRNIDINVFWRSKTGQLLPFRLPSGGSASLKLLFEKKNRNPERLAEVEPEIVDIMGGKMPRRRR